mgnify:CR=1 FL=1
MLSFHPISRSGSPALRPDRSGLSRGFFRRQAPKSKRGRIGQRHAEEGSEGLQGVEDFRKSEPRSPAPRCRRQVHPLELRPWPCGLRGEVGEATHLFDIYYRLLAQQALLGEFLGSLADAEVRTDGHAGEEDERESRAKRRVPRQPAGAAGTTRGGGGMLNANAN